MKLFINAGGKGLRLGELTKDIPKPMVKIYGKPVLHHLVDWAKSQGIDEIVMMNGHLAEKIVDYFQEGNNFGIKISHSNEPYALDSGGPIKFAGKHIDGRFVYISGDHICDVDLKKMMDLHESRESDMTVLVHKSTHPHDSDILQIDGKSKVVTFVSKHETNREGIGDLSNSGLCIIEPKIIDLMDKEKFNFENYIYPKALDHGLKLFGYHSEEFMHDMGTLNRIKRCEDYLWNRFLMKLKQDVKL
tara:strand:+ start:663 stop:1400 length:738 start_codon:yes stop_codon:yes gene_type:complete